MMRSLWTAASGMTTQQMNVDTISNNLANVNTFGYKKERLEFKSLLYDTLQRATLDPANQTGRPVNLQVGHGVRPVATARTFTRGNTQKTDNQLDFAIQGDGFFVVRLDDETVAYTKDGSFKMNVIEDGSFTIVTSEGYQVLGIDEEPITVPAGVSIADISVSSIGEVGYTNTDNEFIELGTQFDIVQFTNQQGLEAIGKNLFASTITSGEPIRESDGDVAHISTITQGEIELANVSVAEEMVNLIVAQRAYELNSKAIQTSDDMLGLANNLKRG